MCFREDPKLSRQKDVPDMSWSVFCISEWAAGASKAYGRVSAGAETSHGPRHVNTLPSVQLSPPQQVDRNLGKSPRGHADGSEDFADALRKKLKL